LVKVQSVKTLLNDLTELKKIAAYEAVTKDLSIDRNLPWHSVLDRELELPSFKSESLKMKF